MYVAFGSGLVACYDLIGHRQWVRRLQTHPATYSEPRLYASNNAGETVLLKPGREFQEVARNTLEPFHASLVFSGTRLYVRGQTNLYCIGTK